MTISSVNRSGFVPYAAINRLRTDLSNRQGELANGVIHDAGRQLGFLSSHLTAMRREVEAMENLTASNAVLNGKLSTMQTSLDAMSGLANETMGQILTEATTGVNSGVIAEVGRSALETFENFANTTYRGEYIFSGINTDLAAIGSYFDAGSPARAAVQGAFQAHFGFAMGDPAMANISGAEMTAFIDGPFGALFDDAGWAANWSGASERPAQYRYALNRTTEVPVTANSQTFRQMASAFVLAAEFGTGEMSAAARDVVATRASATLGESLSSITRVQTQVGLVEARLAEADEQMTAQISVLQQSIADVSGVDEFELATRINELMNSLEASYSVTVRLSQLSILKMI